MTQTEKAQDRAPPRFARMRRLRETFSQYERHLSALAMIAGFAFDNHFFHRIDVPSTQNLFAAYLAVAALAIAIQHSVESRQPPDRQLSKFWLLMPMATQFALGSLWSGFLVFYWRSAVLTTAWPFLVVLAAIFIGNEAFKRYHARLAFSVTLLFFAFYSYAIFTVPIVRHHLGTIAFLISGAVALIALVLYCVFLRILGRGRFRHVYWQIAGGVAVLFALINGFYFLQILPPLPLALTHAGVYHSMKRDGAIFLADAEPESWKVKLGAPAQVHLRPGHPLYVYSAIFAPIALSTRVSHRWEHRENGQWVTKTLIAFRIHGGRPGGYRVYSMKRNVAAGKWRVDIESDDDRLIGRVRFIVTPATIAPVTRIKALH